MSRIPVSLPSFKFAFDQQVTRRVEHSLWVGRVRGFGYTTKGGRVYLVQMEGDSEVTQMFVASEDQLDSPIQFIEKENSKPPVPLVPSKF